jgi:hypothetical protein
VEATALIYRMAAYLTHAPIPMPTAPRILIAGQPKAGTTHLHQRMLHLSGLPMATLVPAYGAREQELSELHLLRAADGGYIACHHTRYSAFTGTLIHRFNLRTVVIVRNLLDVLVSTNDHLDNVGFGDGNPMGFLDPTQFLQRSREERLDTLIDMLAPWHINFFLSWAMAPRQDVVWARYEDIFANPDQTIPDLLSQLGVQPRPVKFHNTGGRLNVGRPGRGREQLSPAQIERLHSFTRHYPGIDFSPIGL